MVVNITGSAAGRIRSILNKDGREGAFFRIQVEGGGCQGFQYVMSIDDGVSIDDTVSEKDGVRVGIDAASIPFLQGARLDWISDLTGEYFKIDNPNATSSCGCGTSFSA